MVKNFCHDFLKYPFLFIKEVVYQDIDDEYTSFSRGEVREGNKREEGTGKSGRKEGKERGMVKIMDKHVSCENRKETNKNKHRKGSEEERLSLSLSPLCLCLSTLSLSHYSLFLSLSRGNKRGSSGTSYLVPEKEVLQVVGHSLSTYAFNRLTRTVHEVTSFTLSRRSRPSKSR